MVAHLGNIASIIQKPTATVVISAHWEETDATITARARPPIIYDYYGFPPESYSLNYPAPGDPQLAERLSDSLAANDIAARLDSERGFDHGLYISLLLMYPEADIPCVQLSLLSSLEPGSGFSFHNLRVFDNHGQEVGYSFLGDEERYPSDHSRC